MNELKDLIRYLKQPSWSLEEAAHLVHGKIPGTSPSDMSPVSSETTSATHLWLKGQFDRGRLYSVDGDQVNPRFLPGTILRFMEKRKRRFSKQVRNIYDAIYSETVPREMWRVARDLYVSVAEQIWNQFPDMPAAQVSIHLEDLHGLLPQPDLPMPTLDTIRKWLRHKGPRKAGRPNKDVSNPENQI